MLHCDLLGEKYGGSRSTGVLLACLVQKMESLAPSMLPMLAIVVHNISIENKENNQNSLLAHVVSQASFYTKLHLNN